MRSIKEMILSIFLIIFLVYGYIYGAAFEDIGSVRARGMGDAYEAISGGIDSIHYNPAGTAYMKSLEIFSEYGKPAIGFDDGASFNSLHFGVGIPFSKKPYLIWLNYIFKGLTIGNENKVVRDGSFSVLFHNFFVSDFMYERLFKINIGKSLDNLFEGARMSAGINFNIYNMGFEMTEDLKVYPEKGLKESTTGFGIDVGMTYDFSKYIRIGFVVMNLLEPNISLFEGGKEYVNQKIGGGLSWKLGDIWYFKRLLASISMMQISRDKGDIRKPESLYKAGVESWYIHPKAGEIGYRFGFETGIKMITFGITYRYKFKGRHKGVFDYALNYPFESRNIKNYFSLGYRFSFPDYYFDYRSEKDIEEENREIEANYKKGLVIVKYKVLPNDNLFNISLIHYGTPGQVELLKKHNKIKDERELPEEIEVPYNAKAFELYKVQPGDTLESISEKYYGTPDMTDKIRKFNKIPFSRLRVGRILVIPIEKENKKK